MASRNKIDALDRVFSKYIRLRDSTSVSLERAGYCCSCGKLVAWQEADAGHFINRRWMATRWDERNVHLQCRACNRFDEGNLPAYSRFMDRKYGTEVVDNLLLLKRQSMKYTDFDLDILIKEYRQKVKDML